MRYDAAVLEKIAQRFRREMWTSVVPEAVTESGVEVARFGPVQATAFGDLPEVVSLNQIQGAAEPGAIDEGHLVEAIEWMRQRELSYWIPVAEADPGGSLAEAWLGARGYEPAHGWVRLVRDLTLPPAFPTDPGIEIFELGGEELDGEALSTIIADALDLPAPAGTLFFSLPERPNWRCYTAALGPEELVVSTASMMIEGEIAQLGPGNTVEAARGRGCNLALLKRRLVDARAQGCKLAAADVWGCEPDRFSAAARNLLRAGFEVAHWGTIWRRPAPDRLLH